MYIYLKFNTNITIEKNIIYYESPYMITKYEYRSFILPDNIFQVGDKNIKNEECINIFYDFCNKYGKIIEYNPISINSIKLNLDKFIEITINYKNIQLSYKFDKDLILFKFISYILNYFNSKVYNKRSDLDKKVIIKYEIEINNYFNEIYKSIYPALVKSARK